MPDVSRRDFLVLLHNSLLAGSGLLALGGLARFLGYQSEPPPPTKFDLGPAADYPPGSRTVVPAAGAMVLRTAQGFTAFGLICPHLGCRVRAVADGFACPCHGSQFDASGGLRHGPATRSLRPLRVTQTAEGRLVLHADQ